MTKTVVVDLDALQREAARWLRAQPCDRPLDPIAIDYFRRTFCVPQWVIDAVNRETAKDDR